jgi:hypothetical protein
MNTIMQFETLKTYEFFLKKLKGRHTYLVGIL